MSANQKPIFVGTIKTPFVTIPSGAGSVNAAKDGTGTVGTTIFLLFTADATNGSVIQQIVFAHLGTNVVTAACVFVNNGSTNATATNNALVADVTVSANTISQVAASTFYTIDFGANGLNLQAGYKVYVSIGTQVAAGFVVHARGAGDLT